MLRIGLAQINLTVGDLSGNADKVLHWMQLGHDRQVDILVFPELTVTGYPPEDLLLKPQFVQDNLAELDQITASTTKFPALVSVIGFVDRRDTEIYNAAALLNDGSLMGVYHKVLLPNYSVFDEKRYFNPGEACPVFRMFDASIGVSICEDIWHVHGPAQKQAQGGAQIVININASPYHAGKGKAREKLLSRQASQNACALAYCNLVGGQDELVFDGQSLVLNHEGKIIAAGQPFEEELVEADIDTSKILESQDGRPGDKEIPSRSRSVSFQDTAVAKQPAPEKSIRLSPFRRKEIDNLEEIYRALVFGTGDYVRKNRFQAVTIGLSGGIDSGLTTVVAVNAVGPAGVVGVFMPSVFTSRESQRDAAELADNLGIQLLDLPIGPARNAYTDMLANMFEGLAPDHTEENIQARIRGNILMALSNKFGWLVLSTGNKSETSVGYTTLYGDMSGGFSVLKDVPKTLVYKLARHINNTRPRPIIPVKMLDKPPSAELRAEQKDEDSLPPYETLDPILEAYIEHNRSYRQIVEMGFEPETIKQVISMVDRNEYKRRQAPPGVKITVRAFGKDWRVPITSRYRNF